MVTVGSFVALTFFGMLVKHEFDLWGTQKKLVSQCTMLLESAQKDQERLIAIERNKNEIIQDIDVGDMSAWLESYNRMLDSADKRSTD